ncbi:ribonuclease H-like domain-containing protein [Halegenticoccus tardaugens]|uniref:ribonuclease H-like domain-containing protein n=1 Tax=Halegenticoccus tardaugens TaxID=2071624 RepID=UPI00100BEB8C|nr:ribonuclease H-like domain-containing protein [Halegenticoccus tardaugens]
MRIENSFIPVRGVGEATERTLWRRGITHWDEFDGSAVGETTARRIESFIDEATARLDAGDSRFFHDAFPSGERWRLYENFRDDACFFDIETTGLSHDRDDVTTASFHRGGETTTLVRGDDLAAETVREALCDAPLIVSFNGKRFDVPFLERSFDVEIDNPHLDLMYPCKKLGLTGGLKRVERDVGIERDRPDLSGRDAVRLWREYERGDDAALDALVSYNRDDAANLRTLMDRVADSLHEETFGVVESA